MTVINFKVLSQICVSGRTYWPSSSVTPFPIDKQTKCCQERLTFNQIAQDWK